MASTLPEDNLRYVLEVIKTATDFKADYHALAAAMNINNANNAQKKFKAIVERGGMKLVSGRVIAGDGDGTTAAASTATASPATPKRKAPGKRGRKPKKAKNDQVDEAADEDAEANDDAGSDDGET